MKKAIATAHGKPTKRIHFSDVEVKQRQLELEKELQESKVREKLDAIKKVKDEMADLDNKSAIVLIRMNEDRELGIEVDEKTRNLQLSRLTEIQELKEDARIRLNELEKCLDEDGNVILD